MSYCRFGEADIYIYPCNNSTGGTGGECCGCILSQRVVNNNRNGLIHSGGFFETLEGLRDHVQVHIETGHNVPDYVIPEIEADIKSLAETGDIR